MTDVLLAGDEFGGVAGLSGSDDRMRQGSADAPAISVGVEPNGVPRGVLWLGGGPERFRAVLERQVTLRHLAQPASPSTRPDRVVAQQTRREALAVALATTPDPGWSLLYTSSDPRREEGAESRLTVANGLQSSRGALEIPAHHSLPPQVVNTFGSGNAAALVVLRVELAPVVA